MTAQDIGSEGHDEEGATNGTFLIGLARAFGGAIIFALPMFMTMEMWSIGSSMSVGRFLTFLAAGLLLIMLLAYYSGFEEADGPLDAALDGIIAFAVGVLAGGALLWMFGVLESESGLGGIVGMVAIQAVPAGMGAVLARKQLGGDRAGREARAGYVAQLFLMLAGAMFMAFNVAPTEEMLLIAVSTTPAKTLVLMVFSILLLHLLVYTVGFAGQEERVEGAGFWRTFFYYTLAGYGIALLSSGYVLWTFGSMDGASLSLVATMAVVLGFPAAVGAGIARLVV